MKKINVYILLCSVLVLVSCEDFLNKYPHDSVPYDYVFRTQEDFEVALRGVYDGFKSSNYYGKLFMLYPDVMTQEVTAVMGFTNDLGTLYAWNHNSNDGDIEAMWAQMYFTISRANTILDSYDNIDPKEITDSTRFTHIKGEALAARALCHFDLVRFFAKPYRANSTNSDLGIPYMKSFGIGHPERQSMELVYANIIDDLTTAIPLLNEGEANSYFLTKPAAQALLARLYLYKKEYDAAIKYALEVINNTAYKLTNEDEFRKMWINDIGPEVIWRIGLTSVDASGKTPGAAYYNDAQGKPNPDYIPTNNFLSNFENGDIRKDIYFTTELTKDSIQLTMVNKYPTNPEFSSTSNSNGANMPKVLRLAEMYLILAEAYAQKGDATKAWGYIQTIRLQRIRFYQPSDDPVPQDVLGEILRERQKELAFEGHLFFDLKRNGLGFTRQGKTEAGNNKYTNDAEPLRIEASNLKWTLPIPQAEINANDGIDESQQNPGY